MKTLLTVLSLQPEFGGAEALLADLQRGQQHDPGWGSWLREVRTWVVLATSLAALAAAQRLVQSKGVGASAAKQLAAGSTPAGGQVGGVGAGGGHRGSRHHHHSGARRAPSVAGTTATGGKGRA